MRVCVFSGSRAEFGLLAPLIECLQNSKTIELKLLVSGSHLSDYHGYTKTEILQRGLKIDFEVPMNLSERDNASDIIKAFSSSIEKYSDAFQKLNPDLLILLGDRYEAFAAAQTAMFLQIPIAHIHGGEITEGLIDEAIRHSITKISHIHFVAAQEYYDRVIQLGEIAKNVHLVGPLALENISKMKFLNTYELQNLIGLELKNFILITFHSETLNNEKGQIKNLLNALVEFKEFQLIFSGSNADTRSSEIISDIREFCLLEPENRIYRRSFGSEVYLSLLSRAALVIGNSSSGIIEAPLLGVPTVNIGMRQNGRVKSPSILSCNNNADDIKKTMKHALSKNFKAISAKKISPYNIPGAATKITRIIEESKLDNILLKTFQDV